jgi:4-diphosphocytidyl-2-C-methyl-D-erythritol kinase
MLNKFKLPAFAKINLYLEILGKRDDGFHELNTIFQTISLCDYLTFELCDELTLTCDVESVPTDETNLIIKAANVLRERFNVKKGVKIHLQKNIPSPGGLGGGSSDCAVALLGLAKLWNLEINFDQLVEIGAKLGSDVPFFFYGGTALGTGRGTAITPLQDVENTRLLLITPNENVLTGEAFARLNLSRLTNSSEKSKFIVCCQGANSFDLQHNELKNDFESSVFEIKPEIKRVKSKLLELGANQALLSGSGASVFGIFDNENSRQIALQSLANETLWKQFAVETVSREVFRELLKPCENLLSKSF